MIIFFLLGKGTESDIDYERFVKLLLAFMGTDISGSDVLTYFLPEWFTAWYYKKEYQEFEDNQTALMDFMKVRTFLLSHYVVSVR